MDAFFEPDGNRMVPTAFTRGPWSRDHQHAGPPAALLLRAAATESGLETGQTVRAAFDILRPIPLAPLVVRVRTMRPGRNVEQLEAVLCLAADSTELMRARVWRMRVEAVDLPDGLHDPSPGPAPPEDCPVSPRAGFFAAETAYADAIEWRFLRGGWDEPGPAVAWTRMKVALVAGESIAPVEHLLVVGDAASGISASLDWKTWNFINVDLDVSLEREPHGDWVAMDAVTRFGTHGAAAAHGEYADRTGRVGTSTQALLVGPR
jgi:acyl-Coa thioesterase superfamily protein/acyl-CoA thioesterase superfamily protein